jgi:hypothetical protein
LHYRPWTCFTEVIWSKAGNRQGRRKVRRAWTGLPRLPAARARLSTSRSCHSAQAASASAISCSSFTCLRNLIYNSTQCLLNSLSDKTCSSSAGRVGTTTTRLRPNHKRSQVLSADSTTPSEQVHTYHCVRTRRAMSRRRTLRCRDGTGASQDSTSLSDVRLTGLLRQVTRIWSLSHRSSSLLFRSFHDIAVVSAEAIKVCSSIQACTLLYRRYLDHSFCLPFSLGSLLVMFGFVAMISHGWLGLMV